MSIANSQRKEDDRVTFTDTVFGFFGVPSAVMHKAAVDKSDHAIEKTQNVVNEIRDFKEALAQLEGTLTKGNHRDG